MLPAGGAGDCAVTARARRVLAGAAIPRATAHLHDGHVRADQIRQHQVEDEQQARKPHVSHRIQQLYQAAGCAAAVGRAGPVASAGRPSGPGRLLPGAAEGLPGVAGRPVPGGGCTPAAGQLNRLRPRALAAPRDPLIESLLFYERDARRDLFFYFSRGRPASPVACDIRTTFH